jgi:DNA-binding CsgD family transcriptional regulator
MTTKASYSPKRDGRSRKIYSPHRQRARDARILLGLAAGKTRQQIADEEGIGENYLRVLVGRLREDFDVPNDRALIAAAFRQGVIA